MKLKVVSLSAVLALGALLPLSYMVVQHREARRLAADRGAVVARAALSTTTKFTPPEAPRPSGATTGARLEIGPSQRETAPADPAQAGEIELRGPVGASIKWFISVQNPDGSWGNGSTTLNGHPMDKVGMTGLSLLAFLGAGYTTLSYDRCSGVKLGDVVKNSIQFLTRDQSEDGSFQSSRDVVEQALAALALCEGYAMTASESLKGPARKALNALQAAQKEDGSWGDLYQSLWSSYVLVSGRLGDLALEGDRYKLSQSYFRGQLDAGPNLPAMIGSLLINKDRSHPAIAETVARLSATPPDWSQQDFSYWYMGSMAMFQYDGPDGEIWKAWSRRFKQTLIPFQQKEGYWAGADANSTLVQTALGTLSLQVYYRYANVLGSPK